MNYYNMRDTIPIGRRAAKEIAKHLRKTSPNNKIIVINQQNNRKLGYDLEAVVRENEHLLDWKSYKLEVKGDRRAHETGNLFIELVSQEEAGKLGGFINTPCDYLIYFIIKSRRIFIFEISSLQLWIAENHKGFEQTPVRTPTGESYFTTKGIYVPQQFLKPLSLSTKQFFDQLVMKTKGS